MDGQEPVPPTEAAQPAGGDLDTLPVSELVAGLYAAQAEAVAAGRQALAALAAAVDLAVGCWLRGGRWVFVGAGTSGRLAMAEAAECPPTFGIPPERVVAVLAGGAEAFARAVEGAEDDPEAGVRSVAELGIGPHDLVVGVSASGHTPFVVAAIRWAAAAGAATVAVTSVDGSPLAAAARVAVVAPTGAEPVAGSTRLKAGTAQKILLNVLTTAAMVRLGRVYGNRMVDFRPSNAKLRARAVRTVAEVAGVDASCARAWLEAAGWQVKTAIVCARYGVPPDEAARRLEDAGGQLRAVFGRSASPTG